MDESYFDLMRSLPHWGFEITLELLTGLLVYPLIRWGHNRLNERLHRELDAEHGFVHKSQPTAPHHEVSHVRVLYPDLLDETGKQLVREAEVWIK